MLSGWYRAIRLGLSLVDCVRIRGDTEVTLGQDVCGVPTLVRGGVFVWGEMMVPRTGA